MDRQEIEKCLDELMSIIEGVKKEELEREIKKFLDYGVPLKQAKQLVIKRYGCSSNEKSLEEIEPNESNIGLLCKVVSINPKEVEARGEKKKIFYGFLGDETAVRSFTAWKDFGLEKGDVIKIKNAYAREWKGEPQINLSESTEIEKADPSEISFVKREPVKSKIGNLTAGMGNVGVVARILSLQEREVSARGEEKVVYSGILGDETGKVRYTSWEDFGLKEGEVIEISNGYVKSWRGAPQLIFDSRATVKKLDSDRIPPEKIGSGRVPISKLVEKGGAVDVIIEGTVLEIRKGSGLIHRCPECNRAINKGICRIHGEVDGEPDIRIKAVVDDGTGAVDAIMNRDITEKLLEKTLEECMEITKEEMSYEVIMDEISELLTAKPLRIKGNAFSDDYGVTFIAEEAEILKPDIEREAEELLRELGG